MKKITFWLFAAMFFISTATIFGQSTLTGKVVDESNQGLPGANVILNGTTKGTTTDFDGNFKLIVSENSGTVSVSFVGYDKAAVKFNGSQNLGTVALKPSAEALSEVVVTGVVDIAKDRQTPVAVSTIKAAEIQQRLGSQELVQLLNDTPSIYATRGGGGIGDSRINVRGFDQRNTAVLINGVPVNDMENGWVYWSNWAGLSDVTTAMQVQRGLGSSKLAISSVGGTINVITKTTDRKEGGSFSTSFGDNSYFKTKASYSTGKSKGGFAASFLLSRTQGNGFVDGTQFEAHNYFIGLGYEPNAHHNFQFVFTGAPQWHNQRDFAPSISDYIKYGSDGVNPNIRYNSDWGYLNGKEFTWRRNFYHKPIMSLNWDWTMSDKSKLSSIFYGSWGRGGGTGEIGRAVGQRGFYSSLKTADGIVNFDLIKAYNSGQTVNIAGNTVTRTQTNGLFVNQGNGDYSSANGISRRASMNSHNWFGTIINFHHMINDHLTFDLGTDLRTYTGYHYRVVESYLGGDTYLNTRNISDPTHTNYFVNTTYAATPSWNPFVDIKNQEKIVYYNLGKVRWAGFFGQLEYKTEKVSAFIQASGSQQGFQRVEKFRELIGNQKTSWKNISGGNVKGGLNWNVDEHNNLFANAGYYSKQPIFDAVYLNFGNNLNPNLQNEKVLGTEMGYGFRSEKFRANLNLYRTSWKNRFISQSVTFDPNNTPNNPNDDVRGTANYRNVEEVHSGVELDFKYRPMSKFNLHGMLSVGDWKYKHNISATVFDSNQNLLGQSVLALNNVKVGDAAQLTSSLRAVYEIATGLKVDGSWRHAGNLYAALNPTAFAINPITGVARETQALKLPDYDLFNAGVTYKLLTEKQKVFKSVVFRLNINNLFDLHYISESDTNIAAKPGDTTWKGVNTRNRVFFGWGRTANFTVRFNF